MDGLPPSVLSSLLVFAQECGAAGRPGPLMSPLERVIQERWYAVWRAAVGVPSTIILMLIFRRVTRCENLVSVHPCSYRGYDGTSELPDIGDVLDPGVLCFMFRCSIC